MLQSWDSNSDVYDLDSCLPHAASPHLLLPELGSWSGDLGWQMPFLCFSPLRMTRGAIQTGPQVSAQLGGGGYAAGVGSN